MNKGAGVKNQKDFWVTIKGAGAKNQKDFWVMGEVFWLRVI
jgi:hypothetical protein